MHILYYIFKTSKIVCDDISQLCFEKIFCTCDQYFNATSFVLSEKYIHSIIFFIFKKGNTCIKNTKFATHNIKETVGFMF